ncbi:hypothetical protein IGB42_02253 [Andreprevotia sp. IGB-42]|nr:hypothetical protein IGB42_02253 [Andreprevotia sp. IGB-42]
MRSIVFFFLGVTMLVTGSVQAASASYLAQDIAPCIVATSPNRGACVEAAALLAKATELEISLSVLPC